MKVFFSAVQAGNRSGTGRYTEELARALVRRKEIELSVESRTPVVDLDADQVPARPWSRLLGPGGDYDVMHYPANFCPAAGTHHTVVTVHDLSFLRHPEWFTTNRAAYYRYAFGITKRRAVRFIADSHATKRDLVELARVAEERIDVAHLGVSPHFHRTGEAACTAMRARYGLPGRFFLYVGTLEPRKNLPRLLAAYDAAAGELGQDLVIGGREGWKAEGLQEAMAKMKHGGRVHFSGFIADEDLPGVMSAAEGFVWPSLFEGFGLPPLEALACGVNVLSSETSSLPELLSGHAVLVDPLDTEAITAGLHALAARGAEASAESVRHAQSFTWERCAARVCESYARV